MSAKIINILLLLVALQAICRADDLEDYKQAYYDRKTHKPHQGVNEVDEVTNRLSFKGGSCSCKNAACSCCTGIKLKKFNFDQEGCANLRFNPQSSSVSAALTLNNKSVLATSIPINTTPSICGTAPRLSAVKFCLRVTKLTIEANKLNACVDLETNISKIPTLVLHLPCIKV